jgi:hypothetical protein
MSTTPAYPLVFILCLLTAGNVSADTSAQPPLNGSYQSTDLGGGVYTGRISESWVTATSGYSQVGNTVLVSSIYGPAMGTQWEFWCASVAEQPILVMDVRDSTGTGEATWEVQYTGGQFWLVGDGPWGTIGAIDFTGTIEVMSATTRCWYIDGSVDSVQSNYTLSGRFDPANWDGSCVDCSINIVAFDGSTDEETRPDDYPPFMGSDCGPAPVEHGAWGSVSDIEIRIHNCDPTPVRKTTWGGIKTLYER